MKSLSSTNKPASNSVCDPLRVQVLDHRPQRALELAQRLQEFVQQRAPGLPLQCQAGPRPAPGCDLYLLMAWAESGLEPDDLDGLQAHQALRQMLHQHALPFEVLRGDPQRQWHQALSTLSRWAPSLRPAGAQTLARKDGRWRCDDCDDPDCEAQLFTRLLGVNTDQPAAP